MQLDETRAKLYVVFCLALVFTLSFQTTFHGGSARSAEESGTTIENFTLYSYDEKKGDELTWRLAGEEAEQSENGLTVRKFTLTIEVPKADKGRETSRLMGKVLKLRNEDGEQIAYMPGEVDVEIGEGIGGAAREVRYFFAEGRVSGGEINLIRRKEDGKLDMSGARFDYGPESGEINLFGGFEITSTKPEGTTEISGEKLNWPRGERIAMTGDITATLPSGWKLEAEHLTWDPAQGLLKSSGSASASRDGTQIEGNAINYESEEKKLVVVNGRIIQREG